MGSSDTTGFMSRHPWVYRIRQSIYWSLPVVLLAVLITRADLNRLVQGMADADVSLVLAALGISVFIYALTALRWGVISRSFTGVPLPFGFLFKHHVFGLAISKLAPGTIGWDVYRVIAVARRTEQYMGAALTVLVEKFVGMIGMCLLFLAASPFALAHAAAFRSVVQNVRMGALALVFACTVFLALFSITRSNRFLLLLAKSGERLTHKALLKLGKVNPSALLRQSPVAPEKSVEAIRHRGITLLLTVCITLGIQMTVAFVHWLLFRALGHQLPLSVNLMVVPMISVILFLPISFGALGVREASYVFLYGAFSIPIETSLLAAVFALSINLCWDLGAGAAMLTARWAKRNAGPHNDIPKRL